MGVKEIKHEFMAFRNGVVSDVLRRGGMTCYNVIFGLNLPQLKQIAAGLTHDHSVAELAELAKELWSDKKVRESRLLALHLPGLCGNDASSAMQLMKDVQTREEAEVMCLRVLRDHSSAHELAQDFKPENAVQTHLHEMLRKHLQ